MPESRPYCLQCGSSSVGHDVDGIDSRESVYCLICGNRQYKGSLYVGFEMREVAMSQKGTCKNCKREDMSLPREGLCGTCGATSHKYPDPGPERDKAMADIKARIQGGKLRLGTSAKKDPGGRTKKAADPRILVHPSEAAAEAVTDARIRPQVSAPAAQGTGDGDRKTPAAGNHPQPVIVPICFAGADLPLYRQFEKICSEKRRDPQVMLLIMIDDLIKIHLLLTQGITPADAISRRGLF